jgi:chromate transporter
LWVPQVETGAGAAALHGLKLVALAVVAHAVVGMARQLCPDARRASIAAIAAALVLVAPQSWMQVVVIALGMAAGVALCRSVKPGDAAAITLPFGRRLGWALLAAFVALLACVPLTDAWGGLWGLMGDFYRAGALVFGGGHVVLPLLQEAVVEPGLLTADDFLAGYGAAQAVPGPLFTLAAYLGAKVPIDPPALTAAAAIAAIFLPGLMLVAAALPLWASIVTRPKAASAVAGANAAVVGVLAAALYDPVWTSAVSGPVDVAIATVGFVLLAAWRANALWVVAWCVAASIVARMALG